MKMKNISPIDLQFFFTYFCYSVLSDLITNFKIWTNIIIMYIVHPLWRCNALGNWKYWVLVYDRNRFGIGFRPNFGHFGRISVWPKWKKCFRYRFRYRPKQKFCIGNLPKHIQSQIVIQFANVWGNFFSKT